MYSMLSTTKLNANNSALSLEKTTGAIHKGVTTTPLPLHQIQFSIVHRLFAIRRVILMCQLQ